MSTTVYKTSRATPPHRQNLLDVAQVDFRRQSETGDYKGRGQNCQAGEWERLTCRTSCIFELLLCLRLRNKSRWSQTRLKSHLQVLNCLSSLQVAQTLMTWEP